MNYFKQYLVVPNNKLHWNGETTALLSWTSAMGCWSWSLPAGDACPLAYYGPDTICSSCYAMQARFNTPAVSRAQWIRYEWTKHMLQDVDRRQRWVDAMGANIAHHAARKGGYFRWLDSGDLFSLLFILAITDVCRLTPDIRHWVATRAWRAPSKSWRDAIAELAALQNVAVRPSALHFDAPAPLDGSAVFTDRSAAHRGRVKLAGVDHAVCPKSASSAHGASCESENCRSCWTDGHRVAYLEHGHVVSPKELRLRSVNRARFTSITIGETEA